MIRKLAKLFCEITGVPDYWVRSTVAELHMFIVRMYSLLPVNSSRINRAMYNGESLNIIFGCGSTSYSGWRGVDCFFASNVDFVLDLRRKLPFMSGSVDYCYSEHFLEHLWNKEALLHLSEVFRILKPGGRYRVVVPAAFRFISRYGANDTAFFRLAFPWAHRPMDAIREIVYFSGAHRNIYNYEELEYLAMNIGFRNIILSNANESEIELLRIDRSEPQRVAESLYVEMVK